MRILLVEDDTYLGESTSRALRSQQWFVDWIRSGESIMYMLGLVSYDVIILDVGLPGKDGFEILHSLRAQNNPLPVLMLTARDTVDDRVYGFQLGADDYLVKPFALKELVARIQAITRRSHTRKHNEIIFSVLRIDLTAKRAYIKDKPLELLPREWAVLVYILNNLSKVLSKEQIMGAISDWDDAPSTNAIEVHISRLRTKLAPAGIAIRTIRGFGYLIEESINGVQS